VIAETFPDYTMVSTSIIDEERMAAFAQTVFGSLGIMRVYCKTRGKPVDYSDPIIIPIGGNVEEAALELHRDFAQKLKFAKVWGEGKHDGQRVQKDFILSDGDTIEFHL